MSDESLPSNPPFSEQPLGARWLRLCQGADQLERSVLQCTRSGSPADKAALSYLEAVLEDFPRPEDPSREVQAFAVHRLAYSIYEAIVTLG